MQQQKICRLCEAPRQRCAFNLRQDARDGLRAECSKCLIGRVRSYQNANMDAVRRNRRRWKERHPEQAAAGEKRRKRNAYPKNAEKIRARMRRNRASDPEKARAWWKSEHGRMVRRLNQNRRRARQAAAPATLTIEEWEAIVSAFGGLCAYACGRPWEEIDHVLAVSKGGGLTAENVVPACGACNVSKHNRPFEEFCAARGVDPSAVLARAAA